MELQSADQAPREGKSGRQMALEAPGGTFSVRFAHDQTQIECGDMDQKTFEDIRVVSYMRAPHPAAPIAVSETALDQLSPPA